jgi:hypothetical protein
MLIGIKIKTSKPEDTHRYDPAKPIMAKDYAARSILSCDTFYFTMAHHRRGSVRQAHTSGACFSGMIETSTRNQRLILILLEASFIGRGFLRAGGPCQRGPRINSTPGSIGVDARGCTDLAHRPATMGR